MTTAATTDQRLPPEFGLAAAIDAPSWFEARHGRAVRNFHAGGIPHRRVEEWKYSDLRNALEAPHSAAVIEGAVSADPFPAIPGARLVLRDGRLLMEPAVSGIELCDLGALDEDAPDWVKRHLGDVLPHGSMGEASLALMRGGLGLRVVDRTLDPLHLRFLQSADAVHSRVLIVVEEGASLNLLESHGATRGFANYGVEIVLAPAASLTHVRLAEAAAETVQIEEIGIRMARDSRFTGQFSQAGAKLSRLELAISLQGNGGEVTLSGATVIGGELHADVTTHIQHVAGKTTSRQLFKHAAGGHSRAVYQGKITVQKGADGSDSRQTAKALLLGARAEADLKPELEILADDVKCAHGAAVGDLDSDSLFYLRSRGISESEARRMLISGFLEETVEDIAREDVRAAIWSFIENALPRALGEAA
jgi:Fe-S cluster assembly protein SufD